MTPKLPRDFYTASAVSVARQLLGKTLVHCSEGHRRAGRIVEVEAYVGVHDLACHASKGRTERTDVMFGPGGVSYVYLIYGMYHCFNVVTGGEGEAAAVLVRGIEPLEGIAPEVRTDGPGRLCRALGVARTHNRLDLWGDQLFIEEGLAVSPRQIQKGPRIGVDYAGLWASKPYRFWIQGNRHVSKAPRAVDVTL